MLPICLSEHWHHLQILPPPLFLGAESLVNNHYLLNRLPFPSTECKKGAWKGSNNYLGLFFKDLRNGTQGDQLRKNMKYPPPSTRLPHTYARTHTHTVKYTHTPLFVSIASKDKKSEVIRIDTHIFSNHWICPNIHTIAPPLSSTKLKLDLLREASELLLRKCALKKMTASAKGEGSSKLLGLTAILVCGRFPPSPLLPDSQFLFIFSPQS